MAGTGIQAVSGSASQAGTEHFGMEVGSEKRGRDDAYLGGTVVYRPARIIALSTKNLPKSILRATSPKMTKWKTAVETTHSVAPNIPFDGKYIELLPVDTRMAQYLGRHVGSEASVNRIY